MSHQDMNEHGGNLNAHITKCKKPIKKGYRLYIDSNCMTFWKDKTMDGKRSSCHQG